MKKLSQLDQAFQAAFCTDPIPPGESATCGCGQIHKSTIETPLHRGEGPGGVAIVEGCDCDYSGSFAGMAWRYRHEFAMFFRVMSVALEQDRLRLLRVLPELGGQEAEG